MSVRVRRAENLLKRSSMSSSLGASAAVGWVELNGGVTCWVFGVVEGPTVVSSEVKVRLVSWASRLAMSETSGFSRLLLLFLLLREAIV